jgi:hypothetical protein
MSSDEYQTLRSAPGAYAVLPGHEQITDTVVSHGHQYLIVTNVTALTTGSTEVTGHTIERMRVA